MKRQNNRRAAFALLLACGVSILPSKALAQAFNPAGLPIKPPVQQPVFTLPTIFDQSGNQASPVQTNTVQQTRVQETITIPNSLFNNNSTTILPTDTLRRSMNLGGDLQHGGATDPSEQRSYHFSDLATFLHGQGWQSDVAGADCPELDETDAVTEDTSFAEPGGGIVPISYSDDSAANFEFCSMSDRANPIVIRVNEVSRHLWVFTDSNQFLSGKEVGFDDSFISGMPGAVMSSHDGIMTLHKGTLIVDSGVSEARLATRVAGLKLSPESTAMVDYRPGNFVAVRILACPDGGKAKVRLAALPDKVFELSPGEEVSLKLSAQAASGADAVTTTHFPLGGYVKSMPREVTGVNIQSYKRMCSHVCRAAGAATHGAENDKVLNGTAPLCLFGSEGARFIAADNGNIGLLSGRVLVRSHGPQIVRTQMGDMYMQKNGIVSMERWQGELRAQCCSAPKSVILVAGNFGVPLSWGMETLLVDHQPTWSDAFPNDGVGRRCFELHKLKDTSCVIADFSMPQLILKGTHFHELRKEKQVETKHLRDALLKTAAALTLVTGYKGNYSTQPPTVR